METNKFITGLGKIFTDRLLAPKLLLAPSMRVGQQWLDAVARAGFPALNARARTLSRLALDLAGPALVDRGLRYAAGARLEILVARAFADLKRDRQDYLTRLFPSASFVSALARSLRDLRLAGIDSRRLSASAFELPAKAAELSKLLAAYERGLEAGRLVDYAAALRLAVAAVPSVTGHLFIMPEDQAEGLNRLERELWAALPSSSRLQVPVDRPEDDIPNATDACRLRLIERPERAGAPHRDGSVRIFRAVGEVNEVREVFRICAEEGIPFDDVEILHPQYDAYVPLIHETAALLVEPGAEAPSTFSEGLPARFFRPGRALAAFVEWAAGDFLQAVVVRMVQDGLLRLTVNAEAGMSFTRVAAALRSVPIAAGRDRWLPGLDRAVAAAKQPDRLRNKYREDPHGETAEDSKLQALLELRGVAADLLEYSSPGSQVQRLSGALKFLRVHARGASEADENARAKLADAILEMIDCLGQDDVPGFDPLTWLALLPNQVRVGGMGPRPGKVFVGPLRGGGHSGRGHTFILGLDDGRFPGGTNQDPVLLDRERQSLSPDLPRAAGRAGRAVADLGLLLARLRGRVFLSYSCRDLADNREAYPSQALLSAGRILSGNRDSTLGRFLEQIGPAASFAPDSDRRCLSPAEWWLARLAPGRVREPETLIAGAFPNLGQGFIARDARSGSCFTEYDGWVPEAAPAGDRPLVFSASRLEKLAANPLDYFFQFVLKIEPPEEYAYDPAVWLDPATSGSLLHEVFRRFHSELIQQNLRPVFERDWPRLQAILAEELAIVADELPAAFPVVMKRERRELEMAARIFLFEEEDHCRLYSPRFLEASIGLPQDGEPTAFDTESPLPIVLPDGARVLARGRIDRIDRLEGPEAFYTIWDYKTGKTFKFDPKNPFRQGRCVQNALYLMMAQARIEQIEPGARVVEFGYFFPTDAQRGERLRWSAEELADGGRVIADLCDLAGRGAFCFSNNKDDVKYSDYTAAFGDVAIRAGETQRKLDDPANEALEPFRRLRPEAEKKS